MRLATEPRIVRLPASVEAMARTSQARRGSANEATSGFTRRTAGTFETRFESTAATTVSTAGRSRFAAAVLSNLVSNRSEEHTSELQSRPHLVSPLLLEKKKHRIPAH